MARGKMNKSNKTGKAKRGFAAMDPEKQREIASRGGQASRGSQQQEQQEWDLL